MRKTLICAAAIATIGCGRTTTYVKSDTTLGRVVVYRNGVAYFERYAETRGDSLRLDVPDDKVDDFLKSLTVVDAKTGEAAPISYPQPTGQGHIDMKVAFPTPGPRRLRLSYVTEAPSWKPSYRVVVGRDGKVDLQGWAVVDNTSGEDWTSVRLGVGASSAMSFRFDLKGLRLVARETLQNSDLFAQAPPVGGATYAGQAGSKGGRIVLDVSDTVLASVEKEEPTGGPKDAVKGASRQTRMLDSLDPAGPGDGGGGAGAGVASGPPPPPKRPARGAPPSAVTQMAASLRGTSKTLIVEGYAAQGDDDKMAASLERANRLREQLVRNGVDPNRVIAMGKGEQQGRAGGARVVEADKADDARKPEDPKSQANAAPAASEPIGTSHFESKTPMTVPKGTSAMVSIMRAATDGEVVYLYDPESARGNATYPFRTLRFRNPTDNALESGPVSVFGEGRFIGEGLAEPIPARSVAFVPFALDRQIVVERKDDEHDAIARILTVQRGIFSTEVKHTRRASFSLYNRLPEKATVYLRHTVAPGYALTKAPGDQAFAERIGGAHLFRIVLDAGAKADVSIEEATPVFRSNDIRTTAGMDLVRAYVSAGDVDAALRAQIQKVLDRHAEMTKIDQQIATVHEQMAEYRTRMDELHAQLVTLKAVRTAGPLMAHLEKKLQEISEKLSKATVEVVSLQEKLMVARVHFQTGVGELTLESPDRDGSRDSREASR